MGFDLYFQRMNGSDEPTDGDRAGLDRFLASRGLRGTEDGYLIDGTGANLAFDGHPAELTLSGLDGDDVVEGALHHASLTAEECGFVYALCEAARFLVVNPQGPPMIVVPARTHSAEQASAGDWPVDPADVVWVDSPEELGHALAGGRTRLLDPRTAGAGALLGVR